MIEIIITLIVGSIVSWLIARRYYYKSSIKSPEWARELFQNLPTSQPSLRELLLLFQKHLDLGDVEFNQVLGRVACPECGGSAKDFDAKVFGDDIYTVVSFTCPNCGWSDSERV